MRQPLEDMKGRLRFCLQLRLEALPRPAGDGLEGAQEQRRGAGRSRRSRRWAARGPRERGEMLSRLVLRSAHLSALRPRETAPYGLKSIQSYHNFCTAVSKDVTYKELKKLLNYKNIMLIDVRETWETLEHGKIPGSINIPLDEVGEALQMNPRDFKEKYHEVKPSKADNLVFSCLAGVRSKKAMDTAISLGFKSAQHYAGGWKEWGTYEFSEKKQGN
ncbi:thiosulfate sulfurtransferase/rhodanese-like domain-containing protein 3 [Castor canadensis]|uniref:Sulfurtransferase n=1 Tax=Castor canadensis TaxID=51338 RepID=A0A8B7VP54_CASCN